MPLTPADRKHQTEEVPQVALTPELPTVGIETELVPATDQVEHTPPEMSANEVFVSAPNLSSNHRLSREAETRVEKRQRSKIYKLYHSSCENQKKFLESLKASYPTVSRHIFVKFSNEIDALMVKLNDFSGYLHSFEFPMGQSASDITEETVRSSWDELYQNIKAFKTHFDSIKHLLDAEAFGRDEASGGANLGTPVRRSTRLFEKKRER